MLERLGSSDVEFKLMRTLLSRTAGLGNPEDDTPACRVSRIEISETRLGSKAIESPG